ncbi:MAG: DUF4830 domain-containing protein [Oscillospiraceae bacterium]|nr:DUF4830 domain-containing protein [Oscillospiraceae bacterium]
MFIFTAKFNRKRAVTVALALAVVICAIILIAGGGTGPDGTVSLSGIARNNGQRVQYLQSLGWEIDENAIDEQEIVIPRAFVGIYEEYNAIQLAQGFDLSQFGGVAATRYTYRVLNYPNYESEVVADIIIFRGEIIAGNIQSIAFDGFMSGLRFPGGD